MQQRNEKRVAVKRGTQQLEKIPVSSLIQNLQRSGNHMKKMCIFRLAIFLWCDFSLFANIFVITDIFHVCQSCCFSLISIEGRNILVIFHSGCILTAQYPLDTNTLALSLKFHPIFLFVHSTLLPHVFERILALFF